MSAANMLSTPPLCWTHLVAFGSGGAVFAVVFYCSGRLLSRVSARFCSLGSDKQAEVRYHAAVGLNGIVVGAIACYMSFFGHLSLDLISKDIRIVRHTSAFNLGVLFADVAICASVPLTGPHTAGTVLIAFHHALTLFAELMSLVYGVDPYMVVFHQRMELTAPPTRLLMIMKMLGVSRDAPGYLPLWVGSMALNLCIRVLVLPFYWYNFALAILPRMDEIKRYGYLWCIMMFVCQPCLHVMNIKWWFNGFLSLKRYLMNRKTKVN